ncbi:MAG: phytoene desaturase family protein [Puniceicoccaceae bacterium]
MVHPVQSFPPQAGPSPTPQPTDVLIIGAGLGGLAAALHCRARGLRVTVLEQTDRPGGKCNHYARDGFTFDTGPSLLTMPDVLKEPFEALGEQIEDHLELLPVEPGCRYHFSDGSTFDAPGTLDAFEDALIQQWPGEAEGWRRFRRNLTRLWEMSGPAFLFNPLHPATLRKIPWHKLAAGWAALRPETMRHSLERHFKDPRLLTLFSRFATYNGSDPYRTPATFNVIPYAELAFGSWTCRGGLYSLVRALEALGQRHGVEFHYSRAVEKVTFDKDGIATGADTSHGHLAARCVICNADAVAARTGTLLADHRRSSTWQKRYQHSEPSVSGFVILAARDSTCPSLGTHNVFFPSDYTSEFRDIFHHPQPLQDPTIYLSIPARHSPEMAPTNAEGWFILINAPSLKGFEKWDNQAYQDRVLDLLYQKLPNCDSSNTRWAISRSPHHLKEQTGAWFGSIYGPSSNSMFSAFLRVPNFDRRSRMGFAGGSAHPGGGIPLALLSGRHAATAALRTLRQ